MLPTPQVIAALLAFRSDREKAAKLVARYLAIDREIEERRKEEARLDIHQTIEEMLAEGSLVRTETAGSGRPAGCRFDPWSVPALITQELVIISGLLVRQVTQLGVGDAVRGLVYSEFP